MTQVTITVGAQNLDPVAVCVGFPLHGTFDLIVKGRPATI